MKFEKRELKKFDNPNWGDDDILGANLQFNCSVLSGINGPKPNELFINVTDQITSIEILFVGSKLHGQWNFLPKKYEMLKHTLQRISHVNLPGTKELPNYILWQRVDADNAAFPGY